LADRSNDHAERILPRRRLAHGRTTRSGHAHMSRLALQCTRLPLPCETVQQCSLVEDAWHTPSARIGDGKLPGSSDTHLPATRTASGAAGSLELALAVDLNAPRTVARDTALAPAEAPVAPIIAPKKQAQDPPPPCA
jgi:hypothetical protein